MVQEAVAAATSTQPLTDRPDAAPSNAAAGAEHVLKFDPLDFDPEHLSLSSKPTAGHIASRRIHKLGPCRTAC